MMSTNLWVLKKVWRLQNKKTKVNETISGTILATLKPLRYIFKPI